MIGLISAVALSATAVADVSEFFPLKLGTKWTYEMQGGFYRDVDEAKSVVSIGEKDAVLITTTRDRKVIDTKYYRIDGDTVYLVANDPNDPIPTPQPILKYSGAKTTWTYEGRAQFFRDWIPVAFRAQVVSKGKRSLFGADRECIELTVDAMMDQGASIKTTIRQVTTYASGIGWIEMKEKQKTGSKTTESTIRLVKFEPAP